MPQIFASSRGNRIGSYAVGAVLTAAFFAGSVLPWIKTEALFPVRISFSLGMGVAAVSFAVWFLWILSFRVEIGADAITRRSFLGARVIPLDDIETAILTSRSGYYFLTVRARHRRWFMLSTHTFSKKQLCEIQDVLVGHGTTISRNVKTTIAWTKKDVTYLAAFYILFPVLLIGVFVVVSAHHHHRQPTTHASRDSGR